MSTTARTRMLRCLSAIALAGCGGTTAGGASGGSGVDAGATSDASGATGASAVTGASSDMGGGGGATGAAAGTTGAPKGTTGSATDMGGGSGGTASGSGSLPDASADGGVPAAQAFVYGTLAPTSGGSCAGIATLTPFLTIGSAGATGSDNPMRVPNGGSYQITCSVMSSSAGFAIALSAKSLSTTTGGSFTLQGTDVSPSSGGTNLVGTFLGTTTNGQYSSATCTLTYETSEGAEGIASGRIWGHVECPGATNGNVTVAAGMPSTCDVSVDFVFENCAS